MTAGSFGEFYVESRDLERLLTLPWLCHYGAGESGMSAVSAVPGGRCLGLQARQAPSFASFLPLQPSPGKSAVTSDLKLAQISLHSWISAFER